MTTPVLGFLITIVLIAGDGYLETLEGVRVPDLLRLAAGSGPW